MNSDPKDNVNDPNITVGNKPLDEYFGAEKEKQEKQDLKEVIKSSRRVICYHTAIKEKNRKPITKRVAKRVIHWTPDMIRERYGIMKRRYEKKMMDVIWVLLNQSPTTATEIYKVFEGHLDMAIIYLSLSRMFKSGIILKTKHPTVPNMIHYSIVPEYLSKSVEVIYQLTLENYRARKQESRRGEEGSKPPPVPSPQSLRNYLSIIFPGGQVTHLSQKAKLDGSKTPLFPILTDFTDEEVTQQFNIHGIHFVNGEQNKTVFIPLNLLSQIIFEIAQR